MQRLEKKLKVVPLVGEKIANMPVMVSLIKSYVKKEYTDIPIGTVIAVCWKLVNSDVEEYKRWREKNHKEIDI